MIARHTLLATAATATGLFAGPAVLRAQTLKILKLSHQFPGGTLEAGNAHDCICRKFAQEAAKRTGGGLEIKI